MHYLNKPAPQTFLAHHGIMASKARNGAFAVSRMKMEL